MMPDCDFYERFPFPGPCGKDTAALLDQASGIQMLLTESWLEGGKVVDIGCGTGQRLINLAQRLSKAWFVGVDPSPSAIDQARCHARAAGVSNIEWKVDWLNSFARCGERFDLVIASGLIHHLDDPKAGISDLARLVSPEGALYAWLYHAIGEFDRLRQRELARIFCPDSSDLECMTEVAEALGLRLPRDHYGPNSVQVTDEGQAPRAVVDAFFQPMAASFRFGDSRSLLQCSGLDWYCINSINTPGASYLLNPADARGVDCLFALKMDPHLRADGLRRVYASKGIEERLRITELMLKPTGFTLLAGRRERLASFTDRVRHAARLLEDDA